MLYNTSSPHPIAHSIQKNPAQNKLGWEAMGMRADTEQQKRRDTVPSVSERMLGCGGIRRGAYDLVSSHHARGACALVRLLFEKGSSKVYDYSTIHNLVGKFPRALACGGIFRPSYELVRLRGIEPRSNPSQGFILSIERQARNINN